MTAGGRSTQPKAWRRRIAAAALAGVIAAGLLAAIWLAGNGFDSAALERLRTEDAAIAAAIVVLLMALHAFIPFPAELLALGAGALFGALAGAALIWLGAMIGAALSFYLARRLGRPFVESMLPERQLKKLDRWKGEDLVWALLLSRFIPALAFTLINYAAGLTPVSWRAFLWTTGVGILPLTLLMTWMGAEMRG
ncbi:MAG: VTT domain-containing protein, partial [Paracoccaceae bacterium]